MGDTSRLSTRIRGLYTFCFAKPGSMTYTMPSIVSDVSAMLVDTTILRPGGPPSRPGGAWRVGTQAVWGGAVGGGAVGVGQKACTGFQVVRRYSDAFDT
jgi:hypothetical protein